jgi:xanthine dehydrogenase YagR molybdenum-binding subunit
MAYGVLVGSRIAKGTIKSIDSKAAERAPGVLAVISHLNVIKVPGYAAKGVHPSEPPTGGQPLRVFFDNKVYSNDQPIAIVVATSLEKAQYGASLVKVQYDKQQHQTDLKPMPKMLSWLPLQKGTRNLRQQIMTAGRLMPLKRPHSK